MNVKPLWERRPPSAIYTTNKNQVGNHRCRFSWKSYRVFLGAGLTVQYPPPDPTPLSSTNVSYTIAFLVVSVSYDVVCRVTDPRESIIHSVDASRAVAGTRLRWLRFTVVNK